MADPLSALGLGIGALSFILQVTDECIKRYKYFTEAVHMSDSYRYLRVRVQIEQQRFLSFAMEAGLLYDDGKICASLQVNHLVLRDTLVEINSLFQRYEQKNGKYINIMGSQKIPWGDVGEPQTNLMELLCPPSESPNQVDISVEVKQPFSIFRSIRKAGNRATAFSRKLRTIITEPQRLVWVNADRKEFEDLVNSLKDLNSFLLGLLSTSHGGKLEKAVDMNYLELLQLRDDIQGLKELIRALDVDITEHDKTKNPYLPVPLRNMDIEAARVEGQTDETKRQYLISLARLKIRHIEISRPQNIGSFPVLCRLTRLSLDFSSFDISQSFLGGHDQMRRSIASWNNRSVWLEWIDRSYNSSSDYAAESLYEERVVLLTRLLCDGIPSGFRTPECLGYVKFPKCNGKSDLGIVFEKPSGPDMELTLITLRQLLSSRSTPPLTERISLCSVLADCLFLFHSIDWLHKGIRSDNIIFFATDVAEPSLAEPYITGYDLSRPSEVPEMTVKPLIDPSSDIYRHPNAQFGEANKFFSKAYDIYSLGILLLEISLWKPIERILGFEDLAQMKPADLQRVRDNLLGLQDTDDEEMVGCVSPQSGSEALVEVANQCGDSYRGIVETCLNANGVEAPVYRGESRASTKHRLRTMFREQVIDKLRLMKEALSSSR